MTYQELPQHAKDKMLLLFRQGWTYNQIADEMGISRWNVGGFLQRVNEENKYLNNDSLRTTLLRINLCEQALIEQAENDFFKRQKGLQESSEEERACIRIKMNTLTAHLLKQ